MMVLISLATCSRIDLLRAFGHRREEDQRKRLNAARTLPSSSLPVSLGCCLLDPSWSSATALDMLSNLWRSARSGRRACLDECAVVRARRA